MGIIKKKKNGKGSPIDLKEGVPQESRPRKCQVKLCSTSRTVRIRPAPDGTSVKEFASSIRLETLSTILDTEQVGERLSTPTDTTEWSEPVSSRISHLRLWDPPSESCFTQTNLCELAFNLPLIDKSNHPLMTRVKNMDH